MATGVTPIVVPAGIQAGTPFAAGNVLYVAQTSPPVIRSTPIIFVNTATSPQQVQIGPIATVTGATVIGSGAVAGTGNTNCVSIGTNATPGNADDVIIGHGATATNGAAGAVAIGLSAQTSTNASNGPGVSIGQGAVDSSASGGNVIIGATATITTGAFSVVVGNGAKSTGASGVAIGQGSQVASQAIGVGRGTNGLAATGGGAGATIAIGHQALAGASGDCVIGYKASASAGGGGNVIVGGTSSTIGGGGSSNNILIGSDATSTAGNVTNSGVSGSIAIGGVVTLAHSNAIVLGRSYTTELANSCVIGTPGTPMSAVVLGNGYTNAVPVNPTLIATGGSGTDINGAFFVIAGGLATGAGVGGSLVFKTSIVAASGTTPQVLGTALTIDNTQSLLLNKSITKYLNVATVGAGTAPIYAKADLTAQAAAIGATTIYAVPAAGAGLYRVSWVAVVTTAGTTSVLGGATGFQVTYTDNDTGAATTPLAIPNAAAAGNTVGTQLSGVVLANCKASTNLQYQFGYTSTGTAMQYALHVKVEYLG